jgi:hypothetical protein
LSLLAVCLRLYLPNAVAVGTAVVAAAEDFMGAVEGSTAAA